MMTPLEYTTNNSCYAPAAPAIVPDASITTPGMISTVAPSMSTAGAMTAVSAVNPIPSTQDQASQSGPQCGAAPTWFYMLMAFAVMSGIGARH